MTYELNNVCVVDERTDADTGIKESAGKVFRASARVKQDMKVKQTVSCLIALVVYLVMVMINFDNLMKVSAVEKAFVLLVFPEVFVFLIRCISARLLKKDYYRSVNEESDGSLDFFCNRINMSMFYHELSVGRLAITDICNDFVEYDIYYRDGKNAHRKVQMKVVLNWSSEKNRIRFCDNYVVFELCREK